MVKKTIQKRLKSKIKEYIDVLRADGLPIIKVILFGSYAKGKQHKWSDVDLCVISKKFKNSFRAMQYLFGKREITDLKYTIEPVGFHPEDFKDDFNPIVAEIKKYGVVVAV